MIKSGAYGIPGTALKAIAILIVPSLCKFFNTIYEAGEIPSVWTNATLVPIFKGAGSPTDSNNYRGIALLSHIGKIFTRIMKKRMALWVEENKFIDDFQGGFREKRCTTDNAMILNSLALGALKKKGKMYTASIDLRKAFDFTSRQAILFKLAERGISRKMYSIISSMFENSSYAVKVSPNTVTERVRSTSGIFQGCIWSPLLFVFFLDTLGKELETVESESPDLAGRIIRHLLWADDLILMSKTISGLQCLLDKLESFCNYWGLEVNTTKSHIIVFKKGGKLARNEHWTYSGKELEISRISRYLGFFFASNLNWAHHRKIAVDKAQRALIRLIIFFMKNRELPLSLFKNIFTTVIEPIVLYGSELWSVFPPKYKRNAPQNMSIQFRELDKPLLRFSKLLLGLPRGAASSAVLLDLALNTMRSKAFCRVIKYWLKIQLYPDDHIMKHCLRYQESIIIDGAKPWLYFARDLLNRYGFGTLHNHDPTNNAKLLRAFTQRVRDINFSELREEATGLRSLQFYRSRKLEIKEPEHYTAFKFSDRRIVAHLRLNLKYSLPFDHETDMCKMCEEVIDCGYWEHFLTVCSALPPLPNDHTPIPYPYCIDTISRDLNHQYVKRLKMIF